MRVFNSIIFKINTAIFALLLIGISFILFLSSSALLYDANTHFEKSLREKKRYLRNLIEQQYNRLQLTGMDFIYKEDFQNRLLASLKELFFNNDMGVTENIIIVSKDSFLLGSPESSLNEQERWVRTYVPLKDNQNKIVHFQDKDINVWLISGYFDPWGWSYAFFIEDSVKYATFYETLYMQVCIAIISFLVLGFGTSIILRIFLKPISELKKSASTIAKDINFNNFPQITNDEIGVLTHSFIQMQQAIKGKMQEQQEIIDSMPSIIIGIDTKSCIYLLNKEAKFKLNVTDKIIGKNLFTNFPFISHFKHTIDASRKTHTADRLPRIQLLINNIETYHSVLIYPLSNKDIILKFDDISEQIKIQDMIVQSQKMLTLGGLAAGMAHEINNPLAGIMQNLQVMENRLINNTKKRERLLQETGITHEQIDKFCRAMHVEESISTMLDSGERAAMIVKNMLSFARKEGPDKKNILICELIDNAIEIAKKDFNVNKKIDFQHILIHRSYISPNLRVPGIPGMLQQVFLNLVKNSAYAMQEKPLDQRNISISVDTDRENAILSFKDSGIGIPESAIDSVFEPFFTTKSTGDGTGLGLSITYFIINRHHNGKIFLNSKEGKYTEFVIHLPLDGRINKN